MVKARRWGSPIGMLLVAAGLLLPSMYRVVPNVGRETTYVPYRIIEFSGASSHEFKDTFDDILMFAVLIAGGLVATLILTWGRRGGSAAGYLLAVGAISVANLLARAPWILDDEGPTDLYPDGIFTAGVAFYLGLAGGVILVFSTIERFRRPSPPALGDDRVA